MVIGTSRANSTVVLLLIELTIKQGASKGVLRFGIHQSGDLIGSGIMFMSKKKKKISSTLNNKKLFI